MPRVYTVPADTTDDEEQGTKKPTGEPLELAPKDPDEELDYALDWAPRLQSGEDIADSDWVYDALPGENHVTLENDGFEDTLAKFWLRKGVEGRSYLFTNRITTSGGTKMDQTVRVLIQKR
jgi:hypothetical protein